MERVEHPLKPIYNEDSKILILGTMPSVASRKKEFYYAHPKNRFWLTLEMVFHEKIEDKTKFLLEKGIALWDVLASCEIKGSSDASIKNAVPNKIEEILKKSQIKAIFTTGTTAYKYYYKFFKEKIDLPVFLLPSPSPANCKVKQEELNAAYQVLVNYLDCQEKK